MLPRAVWVVISLVATTGFASNAHAASSDGGSVWTHALGASPGLWTGLIILGILAAALIVHLGLSLATHRAAPPALTTALDQAMTSGNYQEAWEACSHWPSAFLSRILGPALERIGQGRELVTVTLAHRLGRERRTVTALTWALFGLGGALPVLAVLMAWAGLGVRFQTDEWAANARALTVTEGNFALIAAAGLGVAATALIFWLGYRGQARATFAAAAAKADELVRDLAYDDLEGLRIGREFDAGTLLGGSEDLQTSGRLRVSRDLTSSCPQCNAPINFSLKTCPHCGMALEWS